MIKKIGFLGLGIMGLPMAINLVKKGEYPVVGYDIQVEKLKLFEDEGGIIATDPALIIKGCDLIFLCMPTNELFVENVEKIIQDASPNTIVVDLGSTSPDIIKSLYAKALKKNIHLIDSPVSGGDVGAINGTLALMCGGDKAIFDKVEPLLHFIGKSVTYMGENGCGSTAKLANNMIVACYLGAMSEGFAFAAKAGIDPTTLFHAIKEGFAGSLILNLKIPKIISRDFSANARVAVHMKDLKNAKKFAKEIGVDIPLSNQVLDYMLELEADGLVNEDHCAVAKIYEKNMHVEIK